ncbi:hypothetical protein [Thalassospira alkalitolerans]|uniref:hypothetical protein n=1 Tax=Thalassospira alkalitolerans TaxID=1293890 RepID=UPI003AA8E0CC
MDKRWLFSAMPLIFFVTLLAVSFGTQAAETKQIARSSKLGIELFGVGGEGWCKADVHLQLSRNGGSPLVGKEETLFPTIRKVFDTECPQMETARVEVIDSAGAMIRDFQIEKENGWGIVPDAPVVTVPTQNAAVAEHKPSAASETVEAPEAPSSQAATPQGNPVVVKKEQPKVKPLALTSTNVIWLTAKYYPEGLDDDRLIDQLASLDNCKPYQAVKNNEFDLRDWRKKVKPEVLKKSRAATDIFEFSFNFRVNRNYDFESSILDIGRFTPQERDFSTRCDYSRFNSVIGDRVLVGFEDLPDSFNAKIYLPGDLGRSAVDRLEETGNEVRVVYRARLKNVGLQETRGYRHYKLKAEFIDVKIYAGKQWDYLLVHHDDAKFVAARELHVAAMKKAEEEQRRVQQEGEDAKAQKLYNSLAGERVVPAKLAALYHDGNPSFDNPYDIAAKAFSRGRKFSVRAFVQVGERDSIGYHAKWPSRVYLTGEGLEEGDWYFVSGMGDGQKIDGALYSVISVDKTTKCDDRICMNKEDVAAYVRSQYPQWSGVGK